MNVSTPVCCDAGTRNCVPVWHQNSDSADASDVVRWENVSQCRKDNMIAADEDDDAASDDCRNFY